MRLTHQSAWDPESRHQPVYGGPGIEPKATCAVGDLCVSVPCAAAVCMCAALVRIRTKWNGFLRCRPPAP